MVRLIQLQIAQRSLESGIGFFDKDAFDYKSVEKPDFSIVLSAMLESSKNTGGGAAGTSSIIPGLRALAATDYIDNIKTSVIGNIKENIIHGVYGRQQGNNSTAAGVDRTGPSGSLTSMVKQVAKKYGLDHKAESDYNPKAVSSAGAMGLMQLMPATAKSLGVRDPFNPRENLEGGAKYLRSLIDRYDGNIKLALAAYNAGPGAVERYKGVPPYKETISYINKINSLTNGMIV